MENISWRHKDITVYLLCWHTFINKHRSLPGQTMTGPRLQKFLVKFKPQVNEHPKWKSHVISYRDAVGGFDLWVGGWADGACDEWSHCPCVVQEDGWPRSTRSRRNVPTVPLGDREEMIHFQHHFTQDDLITLCEWTVPAMRTWQVCRASTLRGVSYEA